MSNEKRDRAEGAFVGLVVGDAVGTTLEFTPKPKHEAIAHTDMVGGGPFNLPVGGWTDDTSMALAMAHSLLLTHRNDLQDQLTNYWLWHKTGRFSIKGYCFDIGNTTANAIHKWSRSHSPYSGSTNEKTAGNGSIMRLSPIVIWNMDKPVSIAVVEAIETSRTTHRAADCLTGVALMAHIVHSLINGASKKEALNPKRLLKLSLSKGIKEVARGLYRNYDFDQVYGTGYVVDTLEAALWAFWHTDTFEDGLLKVVNLGQDSDTTGAVYGQIAGAYYGLGAIPNRWKRWISHSDYIHDMAYQLTTKGEPPQEPDWWDNYRLAD